MKRCFYVIVFIAALASTSFAQLLARDSLQAAINAAHGIATDNALLWVTSGPLTTTGTSGAWLYTFKSPTRTNYTTVTVVPGFVIPNGNTSPSQPQITITLPGTFVNSNTALATAEDNGGSAFRGAHTPTTTQMIGGEWGMYAQDPTRLIWVISYSSTNASMITLIDMITGDFLVSMAADDPHSLALPNTVALNQNYPNPFNPTTTISFSLPTKSNVRLDVFDLMGREVATVANGAMNPGLHQMNFDASKLTSGEYVYRLNANGKVYVRKMTLVK